MSTRRPLRTEPASVVTLSPSLVAVITRRRGVTLIRGDRAYRLDDREGRALHAALEAGYRIELELDDRELGPRDSGKATP